MNKTGSLQLREVPATLPFTDAYFICQREHGRVALAVLAGVPRQAAESEFGAGAHALISGERLGHEQAVEQLVGIKGLSWLHLYLLHRSSVGRAQIRRLGHAVPVFGFGRFFR